MLVKKPRKKHSLYSWRKRFDDAWLLFVTKTKLVGSDLPLEDAGQAVFVRWFREKFTIPYGIWLYSNVNEGRCSWQEGERLNAIGREEGIPDIFIPHFLLYIEFKREKTGKVTAKQLWWHEYLRKEGFTVLVVYGFNDAINQFEEFRKNFRKVTNV